MSDHIRMLTFSEQAMEGPTHSNKPKLEIICLDWLAGVLVAGRETWLPQGTTLYYPRCIYRFGRLRAACGAVGELKKTMATVFSRLHQ